MGQTSANKLLKVCLEWEFGRPAPVVWPILEDSGKAIRVNLPSGPIWMPLHRFDQMGVHLRREDNGSYTCRISSTFPTQFIELLSEFSRNSTEAVIPVTKAGRGPSEKSVRVKVAVWGPDNSLDDSTYKLRRDEDERTYKERQRSMTVPVSQLIEINGKTHLRAWVAKQKLAADERLNAVFTPAIDEAKQQIEVVIAEYVAERQARLSQANGI